MQKLIKDIAQKEPCVIVGRCADYILSDRDDVLNVFIEANTPEKAARIKKLYHKSDDEVKKLLKDVDKKALCKLPLLYRQGVGQQEKL